MAHSTLDSTRREETAFLELRITPGSESYNIGVRVGFDGGVWGEGIKIKKPKTPPPTHYQEDGPIRCAMPPVRKITGRPRRSVSVATVMATG